MRSDHLKAGHVSVEEAKEILVRFNASHFNLPDQEHARYTIPADPRRDDDIRLGRFIAQYECLSEIFNTLHHVFSEADIYSILSEEEAEKEE